MTKAHLLVSIWIRKNFSKSMGIGCPVTFPSPKGDSLIAMAD